MSVNLKESSPLVGTVVTRPVWSHPEWKTPVFGDASTRHNMVVNLGRSYVAELLYDGSYNHKLKFIQCGTGNVTPAQDNVALNTPVSTLQPYSSVTGPGVGTVGLLKMSWVLLGSVFSASYNLQEFGLFVAAAPTYTDPFLVSGIPLMFSRVVLTSPVTVYPWDGTSEKGVAVDWYVQL